jgi:hypothetical protein
MEMSMEEAKAIIKGGLGKAELEFVTSITAPLYWVIREDDKQYKVRNGSAFFLDAGVGPFGVTACHVVNGWREARKNGGVIAVQIGCDLLLDFEGKNRLIDEHDKIDIATFQITASEISSINKVILTGSQKEWPPHPPEERKGIYFSGFPGVETILSSPSSFEFGAVSLSSVANSVSELDISTLTERQDLIDVMGNGFPPENFDFGGISGGPMLTVIENPRTLLRSWSLAGVIYEGPNPPGDGVQAISNLEIIRARRAHFILPDGKLDIPRWNGLNLASST